MDIKKLGSPQEYFKDVLEPNYFTFMGSPSTFQTAFNLASSLFHMKDWVFALKKAEAEKALGTSFANEAALWRHIESKVKNAGFIRDVANASKHVKIDHRPSTSMTHIANTSIVAVRYGEGGYGTGGYGGAPDLKIQDGANEVSFDQCAREMFQFWKDLMPKL